MAERFPNRQKTLLEKDKLILEQFVLYPQCFQKTCTADTKKPGLVWERKGLTKYQNFRLDHLRTSQ